MNVMLGTENYTIQNGVCSTSVLCAQPTRPPQTQMSEGVVNQRVYPPHGFSSFHFGTRIRFM
jgi:hypothetical protein